MARSSVTSLLTACYLFVLLSILSLLTNIDARAGSDCFRYQQYELNSGRHSGAPGQTILAFRGEVHIADAPFLRIHFGESYLANESYVVVNSLKDDSKQMIRHSTLAEWNHTSAYFNGDAVEVSLFVVGGENGVFFSIDEIFVGERRSKPSPIEHICGEGDQEPDDRGPSSDSAVGRLLSVDGTAFIVARDLLVSAKNGKRIRGLGSDIKFWSDRTELLDIKGRIRNLAGREVVIRPIVQGIAPSRADIAYTLIHVHTLLEDSVHYMGGLVAKTTGLDQLPREYKLYTSYPNPFNPATTIKYDLATDSHVSLKLYDVLGREVMTLVDGDETAGRYQVTLNASELSSGVYFYRLTAGDFTDTRRLVLLK